VVRQARSSFPDLVALKRREKPILVECKVNGSMSREERERILELAKAVGGRAFLARRVGRNIVFEDVEK